MKCPVFPAAAAAVAAVSQAFLRAADIAMNQTMTPSPSKSRPSMVWNKKSMKYLQSVLFKTESIYSSNFSNFKHKNYSISYLGFQFKVLADKVSTFQ